MGTGACMLTYAAVLHALWGILLLWRPTEIGATPLALVHLLIGSATVEAWIYLAASASTGFMLSGIVARQWGLLAGLPQQLLLMIGAGGSLWAVLLGQYADGVPRPWVFILADQLPAILTALFHTGALITFHGGLGWQISRPWLR